MIVNMYSVPGPVSTQQEIGDVHPLDSFIIPACESICTEDIFRIVIPDAEQSAVFPLLGFRRANLLGYPKI